MKNFSNQTTLELRLNNRQTILKLIFFAGSITRPALIQKSGLSHGTIASVVAELLEENILVELGLDDSQGGRRATILSINPTFGYVVGIDIGETHICLELFDLSLKKLAQVIIKEPETNPVQVVKHISQNFGILLQQGGVTTEQIIGVGLGVPGVVDREYPDNIQVLAPVWGWKSASIYAMLKKELPVPLYLDNAAKVMTQAEYWFRSEQSIETMVALVIGTGVGGGIIQQNTLYHGPTNSAGELGHTVIEYKGRLCRCGNKGCLEAYVGAPGIIQRLRELAPQHPCLKHSGEKEIIATLVEAAKAQDGAVLQILSDTAQYLGTAFTSIVNVFNPQLIVLGGWVGVKIGPYILSELEEVVKEYALLPAARQLRIELAKFGDDAINLGAATLVLEDFLANSARWSKQVTRNAEKVSSAS